MRRPLVFVCGIAVFSVAVTLIQPTAAQHTPAAKSAAPRALLPEHFGKWTKGQCVEKPAATFLATEAGQRENESCQFSSESGSITVWGASFRDSSSAYEVYTSKSKPGMMPTNVGQAAAFDQNGVLLLVGNVVLTSTANISKDDLTALAKAVEARSELAPLPPVRTYLPAAGRVLGTERYALGPEALKAALAELGQSDSAGLVEATGFSSGVEAMVAKYSSRGRDGGVLLLLEYPTPQLAEQHIHHLDEVLPASVKQDGTGIERKGSLLALVLSASSPEFAKALREDADYETHVTWNEASQTATDPPIVSTLVKIFIGTGVFMVAAVVLGIAFGGLRLVTKRLFPGKVFDRPAQMEVLQLGLSGKRIDPTDFY